MTVSSVIVICAFDWDLGSHLEVDYSSVPDISHNSACRHGKCKPRQGERVEWEKIPTQFSYLVWLCISHIFTLL